MTDWTFSHTNIINSSLNQSVCWGIFECCLPFALWILYALTEMRWRISVRFDWAIFFFRTIICQTRLRLAPVFSHLKVSNPVQGQYDSICSGQGSSNLYLRPVQDRKSFHTPSLTNSQHSVWGEALTMVFLPSCARCPFFFILTQTLEILIGMVRREWVMEIY